MKKLSLIIAIFCTAINLNAIEIEEKINRIITVTGSAEMIVPPDEIELEITLTEQGSNTLTSIEKSFWSILLGHEISTKNAILGNVNTSFYWYYWWYHRNDSRKSKQIYLKLDAKTDFMKLVRDLDEDYITSIKITQTSNKEIQELRQQVKIEAIKAAKRKAKYLLEAVDSELGKLMSVEEITVEDHNSSSWYWRPQQEVYSNSVLSYGKSSRSGSYIENVPEIKLRYQIKTKFEII